jgi:hypothetical protein
MRHAKIGHIGEHDTAFLYVQFLDIRAPPHGIETGISERISLDFSCWATQLVSFGAF